MITIVQCYVAILSSFLILKDIDTTGLEDSTFLYVPKSTFVGRFKTEISLNCQAVGSNIQIICNGAALPQKNLSKLLEVSNATFSISKAFIDNRSYVKCHCEVTKYDRRLKSKHFNVSVAYIRPFFHTNPKSKLLEIGQNVTLHCRPPHGEPPPEIIWKRNGKRAYPDNTLDILDNGAELFIREVVPDYIGNYTCIAKNIGGKRSSDKALIQLKDSQNWGAWDEWSHCDALCGKGREIRQRKCLSMYYNNKHYDVDCSDNESRECEGLCLPKKVEETGYRKEILILCSVSIMAFFFIFTTCFVFILVIKKCSSCKAKPQEPVKEISTVKIIRRPDLTYDLTRPNDCILTPSYIQAPAVRDGTLGKVRPSNASLPGMNDSPVGFLNAIPSDKNVTPIPSSQKGEYEEAFPCGEHFYENSPVFKNMQEPCTCAIAQISSIGGRLLIPECGVGLLVPSNVISKNHSQEFFIAVSCEDSDKPVLARDAATSLSSVILIGSEEQHHQKPLVVIFEHSADQPLAEWCLSLVGQPDDGEEWETLYVIGEENCHEDESSAVFCFVDEDRAYILTQTLHNKYCLVGRPQMNCIASKRLKLVVFGSMISINRFSVRVYILEDCKDAFQNLLLDENRIEGRLLDKPHIIHLRSINENISVECLNLSTGWKNKESYNYTELLFNDIWQGTKSYTKVVFTLENSDNLASTKVCGVEVLQKSSTTSIYTDVHLNQDLSQLYKERPSVTVTVPDCLSQEVKDNLAQCLDIKLPTGHDWRVLAAHLGIKNDLSFFSSKYSPTKTLLSLVEARCSHNNCSDVSKLFRSMGRSDLASYIEKELQKSS